MDSFCARSLGVFLNGYDNADCGVHDALHALLDTFDGPAQADACTRAYLSYEDSSAAASAVLAALEKLATGVQPEPGPFSNTTFVEAIREPILHRRPQIILGDPTVVSLYNYVRGFLCGLEVILPVEAAKQTRALAEFERWLRVKYEAPCAAWYKMIRVYGGTCEAGLERFIELWDEFESTTRELN